jgi:hypothetical protein
VLFSSVERPPSMNTKTPSTHCFGLGSQKSSESTISMQTACVSGRSLPTVAAWTGGVAQVCVDGRTTHGERRERCVDKAQRERKEDLPLCAEEAMN